MDRSLGAIRDGRSAPRIPTATVLRALVAMALARLGSLNALGQVRPERGWKSVAGGDPPSASTHGRVMSALDSHGPRDALRGFYARRKRNKSLKPFVGGLTALVVDGHESSASYRRSCPECLKRAIHTAEGDRVQHYHRLVAATLLCDGDRLLVDREMQRPGEDEVACAMRLLERIFENYPRAFQIVVADGLYLRANFFNLVTRRGKDVMAVLKDEQRDLMKDARGLFDSPPDTLARRGRTACRCWDIEGFTSWPGLDAPVRVVRSLERTRVRRQRHGRQEENASEWVWATSIPKSRLPTEGVVRLGHGRRAIENEGGFNELVNTWHADHVYRHTGNAILAFWLLSMLVFNLFHAFIRRNLKPVRRMGHTDKYWADQITAGFYLAIRNARAFAPP